MLLVLFNHTDTSKINTLSLHDALPISSDSNPHSRGWDTFTFNECIRGEEAVVKWIRCLAQTRIAKIRIRCCRFLDRKSTRMNSSHLGISYAVFCLKYINRHDYHCVDTD